MSTCSVFLPGILVLAIGAHASAQTVFPEIEPNGTKGEATQVACMTAGDALTGTSTGTSTASSSTLLATADTFRIKTCALPAGIYRHTLTLTTSTGTAPAATIRGLSQTNGVVGSFDNFLQQSVAGQNAWYGFGRQEQIHYRVAGSAASTGTYTSTLSTAPIVAPFVPGTFQPGNLTIDASGQGHTTDTDLWLYDGNLSPLSCGGNDDLVGFQSKLTIPVATGTYYLAISTYNLANDRPSPTSPGCPNPDSFASGIVLDFPDAIAESELYAGGQDLQFSVSDGFFTSVQPAAKTDPFDIRWFAIRIGNPAPPITTYCSGDGSGTACPCANAGAPGNGCASSVSPAGGHLAAGGIASLATDTFTLVGTLLPNNSALYFQGTSPIPGGSTFGDGLRCVGGSTIRLGTKVSAAGTSSYPVAGDTPISIRGMNAPGATRDYQCWYRNAAAYCTPSTFNLTNAVEVTWGP